MDLAHDLGPRVALRFWDLTPGELNTYAECHRRKEEREWYRVAWLACHILAPYSKKRIEPRDLIGPLGQRRSSTTPTTEE